jgi:hypothetical protein
MKIENITQHDAMSMMGSETSEAEADSMIRILRVSGHEDTDEIGDVLWREYLDRAIAESAN